MESSPDTTNVDTKSFLKCDNVAILMIQKRDCTDIVVGVPHHAPAGQKTLPCPEHTDADENAGFLGRFLAEELNCCSIIACNYNIDSNKSDRSDYTSQILRWNPKVLIEIHGHGGKRADNLIEISSGSIDREQYSMKLSRSLNDFIKNEPEFEKLKEKVQAIGEFKNLNYKASKTITITDRRWIAYHIELPPVLRKNDNDGFSEPPHFAYALCKEISRAILTIHPELSTYKKVAK